MNDQILIKQKSLLNAKVPPHSVEAEQAVLGGLMLDNEAWDKIIDHISAADFYRADHRLIFNAVALLSSQQKPFDVLTLAEVLKERGDLERAGGEIYLFELAKNVPSAANIVAYAGIVRERSVLRQLIGVAAEIADSAFNTEGRESNNLLDDAERRVFAIAEQHTRGRAQKALKHYSRMPWIVLIPCFIVMSRLRDCQRVFMILMKNVGITKLGFNYFSRSSFDG